MYLMPFKISKAFKNAPFNFALAFTCHYKQLKGRLIP